MGKDETRSSDFRGAALILKHEAKPQHDRRGPVLRLYFGHRQKRVLAYSNFVHDFHSNECTLKASSLAQYYCIKEVKLCVLPGIHYYQPSSLLEGFTWNCDKATLVSFSRAQFTSPVTDPPIDSTRPAFRKWIMRYSKPVPTTGDEPTPTAREDAADTAHTDDRNLATGMHDPTSQSPEAIAASSAKAVLVSDSFVPLSPSSDSLDDPTEPPEDQPCPRHLAPLNDCLLYTSPSPRD